MAKIIKYMHSLSKIFLSLLLLLSISTAVFADVWVDGYYRKDGTYVNGHYRSDPDGNFDNNWSTKGNVNPYTGEIGTKTKPSTGSYYNNTTSSTNYKYNDQYSPSYSSSSNSSDNSWLWGLGILGGIVFLSAKKS